MIALLDGYVELLNKLVTNKIIKDIKEEAINM